MVVTPRVPTSRSTVDCTWADAFQDGAGVTLSLSLSISTTPVGEGRRGVCLDLCRVFVLSGTFQFLLAQPDVEPVGLVLGRRDESLLLKLSLRLRSASAWASVLLYARSGCWRAEGRLPWHRCVRAAPVGYVHQAARHATAGSIKAAKDIEQGRFAAAGGPLHDNEFTPPNVQIHVAQSANLDLPLW